MNKTLDLCFGGELDPGVSETFNILSMNLRADFNALVTDISRPFVNTLDWWLQGPASRNTFASSFFHYFCSFHLVRQMLDDGLNYDKILVDSPHFSRILTELLEDAGHEGCVIGVKPPSLTFRVKENLKLPMLLIKKIMQHFITRLSGKKHQFTINNKPLNLIDTFMISGYENNDRWYGKLWDQLPLSVRHQTYFVPTIVSTPLSKIFSTIRQLRDNSRNFLIKEDYLGLSDYLYAASYKKRVRSLVVGEVCVAGYDFKPIIEDELLHGRDVLTILESYLLYRFVGRIRESGINVRLAIDWFEGQVIDRSWNFSFNTFYPNTFTVGYRAFESYPFYLCSYPIMIEQEANVLPREMAVQGRGTIETVREFLPELDAIVIPSFKSDHVWSYADENTRSESFRVLVGSPISLASLKRILQKILSLYHKIKKNCPELEFIIKPHPTHSIESINGILTEMTEMPESFRITSEKSLPILLHKSHLLITEASSVCLEALACGLPVIIIENSVGLTFDPVPQGIPESIVRRSRNEEQLADALLHFVSASVEKKKMFSQMGKKIRADYFEPITPEGINKFFKLETKQ